MKNNNSKLDMLKNMILKENIVNSILGTQIIVKDRYNCIGSFGGIHKFMLSLQTCSSKADKQDALHLNFATFGAAVAKIFNTLTFTLCQSVLRSSIAICEKRRAKRK